VVRHLKLNAVNASWYVLRSPPAHSFRDLRVWQKAHEFVLAVYRYSDSFPEREKFGLCAPTASCGLL